MTAEKPIKGKKKLGIKEVDRIFNNQELCGECNNGINRNSSELKRRGHGCSE